MIETNINSMTPSYIQEEIKAAVKLQTIKEGNTKIMDIPDLDYLPNTYKDFCERKSTSLLLFGIHPYFRGIIASSDLKEVDGQIKRVYKLSSRANFCLMAIFGFGSDIIWRFKPILGLTINTNGFKSLIWRYIFIPQVLTTVYEYYYLKPKQQQFSQSIMDKYSLSFENPLCKQAFEDFKIFQQNSSAQKNEKNEKKNNEGIDNIMQQNKEERGEDK